MANKFQGPIPQGADERHFRKTGETIMTHNEKEISVLKKGKFKKVKKISRKPKIKIQKLSAEKAILKDKGVHRLVSEGRTGTFREELMEEAKWLS